MHRRGHFWRHFLIRLPLPVRRRPYASQVCHVAFCPSIVVDFQDTGRQEHELADHVRLDVLRRQLRPLVLVAEGTHLLDYALAHGTKVFLHLPRRRECRYHVAEWLFVLTHNADAVVGAGPFLCSSGRTRTATSCKQQANPYRCDCAEPRASAPRMQCPSASESRFPRRSSSFPGRKKLGWSGDAWIWQGPTLSSPEELANSLLPGRPAREGVQVLPGIGGWWLPGLPTRPPTVEECWLSLGYPIMVIRLYGYTRLYVIRYTVRYVRR